MLEALTQKNVVDNTWTTTEEDIGILMFTSGLYSMLTHAVGSVVFHKHWNASIQTPCDG